jgi:hypothetical protein
MIMLLPLVISPNINTEALGDIRAHIQDGWTDAVFLFPSSVTGGANVNSTPGI